MAKKYLIADTKFLMGEVEFHRDLLEKGRQIKDFKIAGGGWWHIDANKKSVYLYSTSEQFKSASLEEIIAALKNSYISRRLMGFKFYISKSESLSDAMKEADNLCEPVWTYQEK